MGKKVLPLLLIILVLSCQKNNKDYNAIKTKTEKKYYSVELQTTLDSVSLKSFITKIDTSLNISYINKNDSNGYLIYPFEDLLSASDFILTTGIDSIGHKINIVKDSVYYDNILENFYFIRKYLDRPAIYKFNLKTKKINLVWQKWGRKIIRFYEKPYLDNAFFVTRFRASNKGSLPLYTDLRLYMLDKTNDKVKLIDNFGDAFDFEFKLKNSFSIILNSVDTTKTSVIEHKKFEYSLKGELISKKIENYPLSGMEKLLTVKDSLKLVSSNNKYYIELKEDSLTVINIENNEPFNIYGKVESLFDIQWNEPYLLLSFNNIDLPGKSIKVYDLKGKSEVFSVITNFNSEYKFWGSLLAYEFMEKNKVKINFYNLRQSNKFASIELKEKIGISDLEY